FPNARLYVATHSPFMIAGAERDDRALAGRGDHERGVRGHIQASVREEAAEDGEEPALEERVEALVDVVEDQPELLLEGRSIGLGPGGALQADEQIREPRERAADPLAEHGEGDLFALDEDLGRVLSEGKLEV